MMIIMCFTVYRILLRISGMVFVFKLFVLLSMHSVYFHLSSLLTEQCKHSEESDKHFFLFCFSLTDKICVIKRHIVLHETGYIFKFIDRSYFIYL